MHPSKEHFKRNMIYNAFAQKPLLQYISGIHPETATDRCGKKGIYVLGLRL
jgi:hypothetical protein